VPTQPDNHKNFCEDKEGMLLHALIQYIHIYIYACLLVGNWWRRWDPILVDDNVKTEENKDQSRGSCMCFQKNNTNFEMQIKFWISFREHSRVTTKALANSIPIDETFVLEDFTS
jgi:hypothetical protein